MKKFLRKFTVFLLALLLIMWIIQLLVDRRIRGKTVHGYDNLDVTTGKYELLLMGSSRCYVDFDPALFERTLHLKTINIGVNGHSDITMHILRLLNYLARNPPPKFVVLAIDPFTIPGSINDNTELGHKNSFARYAFFPSKIDEPIVNYFKFNLAEKYIPLYAVLKYQLLWDCITLSNANNWTVYGYFRHEGAWDTLAHPVGPQVAASRFTDTAVLSSMAVTRQLAVMDSICVQHGIRLLCVQLPVYKAVYDKGYFSHPQVICSQLGIPFFDLNDSSIDGHLPYFYDVLHMNLDGVVATAAKLFSDSAFRQAIRKDSAGRYPRY